MLSLEAISQVCESIGGIKEIHITDISNMDADLSFITPAAAYSIYFRKYSAAYKEQSNNGKGGAYVSQTLSCILPKKRIAVEHLIQHTLNYKVAIKCVDNNDETFFIIPARMKYDFSTGTAPGESNAYEITWYGIDLKKGYRLLNQDVASSGNDGVIPGDPVTDGSEPTGGGGDPSSPSYYVIVNPTQLAFTPLPSGNTTNLNEMVIGLDGNKYFIDIDGRSTMISRTVVKESITTPGTSWTLANIDLTTINPEQIMVERNGVVLDHQGTATDINHFEISGGDIVVPAAWPLEADEYINVYLIG